MIVNKQILAFLNKINLNRRIYTPDSFKSLPKDIPVYLGDDRNIPVGVSSEFEIKDNILYSKIKLFSHPYLDKLSEDNIKSLFSFVPNGVGNLNENSEVIDYTLKYISIISKEESAFSILIKKPLKIRQFYFMKKRVVIKLPDFLCRIFKKRYIESYLPIIVRRKDG